MRHYVIRQGDYLAKVAHMHRFAAEEVWAHAKNEALRAQRDPDVLNPGDVMFVPEQPLTPKPLSRGAANVYVAAVPKVHVAFVLQEGNRALPNEPYVIEGLGKLIHGVSDHDGLVRFKVPISVMQVLILLPQRSLRVPVRVGHLDPVEATSGQRARLTNLGFQGSLAGNLRASFGLPDAQVTQGDRERALAAALHAFQHAYGLGSTGVADDATLAALVRAHGR
jgi:hypothetical protein